MARDTKLEVDAAHDDALDAIYREHFEFVWCVLHRFGVAAADLDDASQDVFVVAHGRLAEFEGRAAVRTWLYSIAIRVASNRRRKHARRDALLVKLPRPVPDDLEELAARGQARAILESLLDRLDEPKRVVFVLAELEELAVPTIARIVGENPRTVYSRLRAARARVASELDRLHAASGLDEAIVASRARPAIEPERASRVWAGVLAGIAGGHATPLVASAGLSLLGKLAIAGVVAAASVVGVIALGDDGTHTGSRAPAAAPARSEAPTEAMPSTQPIAIASPPRAPLPEADVPATRIPTPRSEARATPTLASAPASVATTSTLAEEIALLDDARARLAEGHDEAALAVLDRYATRFGDGKLRSEASKVRVRALCNAGREREAIAHARTASLPTPQCSS